MSTDNPEESDAPEVVVVGLLRDAQEAFNNAADNSVSIHYGWYDESETRPEITVGTPDESPVNDQEGQTGYSGWRGDGSGPTQTIGGTVEAHLWTDRNRSDVNPRSLLHSFKERVRSVMSANANAPTSDDLGHLAYYGFRRLPPETEEQPTRWHGIVTIGYGYID